ncbi:MAG: methyltransferase domain-containing protein [Sulfuritalea sp.]|jgi:ubiquinone/menaquinone biosynthesis C-methylase UbiE|nr:methyltransferase domain-containing protein [Sulfuritalea sp.]
MSFDSAQFKRLERAGYNRIGPRYLAASGARRELATALLAAARLAPGQRVLDLASGPGLLARGARDAVGDSGLAVASDISEGQLACCPDLARIAADGEALPFANQSFDRVLCGLGLMFFPDEQAALREMRRVLRTDGLLALSVWGSACDVPLVETALSCMRRLLPPPKVARPSIFRFGDAQELARRLASADYCDIQIRPCRFTASFSDAGAYWQGFLDLAGGAAESLSRLPADKQRALAVAVREDLTRYAATGGYELTSTVLVATARPV